MDNEITSPDQQNVLTATSSFSTDANIRIFLVANPGTFLVQAGREAGTAYGFTNKTAATCWVWGLPKISALQTRTDKTYDEVEEVLSTIGHEVGHVISGYGHPEATSSSYRGMAPLDGTDWPRRLMCGKKTRDLRNGKLLVKAEWDAAETWLSEEERQGRMAP